MTTILALLRQRCPACHEGPIYLRGMQMHKECPVCGALFEREHGYFLGALYISYAVASIFLGLLALTLHLSFPDLDLGLAVLIAAGLFLPFVPAVTRYARVVWMYFDRWAWPSRGPDRAGHGPKRGSLDS